MLQYLPSGEEFVCVNGKNRYTRALYGGHTAWRLETGDRPIFATYVKNDCRNIRFRLHLPDGTVIPLEETDWCEARYNPGTRTYALKDKAWGENCSLKVSVLASLTEEMAVWELSGELLAGCELEVLNSPIRRKKLSRSGDMGADPPGCFEPAEDGTVRQMLLKDVPTHEVRSDKLEGAENFEGTLHDLIRSTVKEHKRILFNGNGYDDAWLAEAERRGLLNLRTTPEALPYYLADKNVALFTKHRVYTRTEMEARYEIHLENYSKVLNIEALTMLEMARRDIMPAVSSYLRELSETAAAIHAASVTADCSYEESIIPEMSALLGDAYRKVRRLDEALMGAKTVEGSQALANYYRDKVFSAMAELRITIDQLETMTPSDKWPVPSYGDLLFSVR